mmetsp:Transcript_23734/g.35567  ORF Transcript_23734/g.35567 Transcript_23734/m.35567 type:complete len:86 (+) Transcript_23734:381-638(+)
MFPASRRPGSHHHLPYPTVTDPTLGQTAATAVLETHFEATAVAVAVDVAVQAAARIAAALAVAAVVVGRERWGGEEEEHEQAASA